MGLIVSKIGYLALLPAMLASFASVAVQAADRFDFNEHLVAKVFKGKLQLPDFKGRDKEFADFRTRITETMKAGVTFAGEFSVVQFGCGSGCSGVVVANNRTGQLFGFPRGGEFNQALTLEYKANSRLMLARWYTDSLWETCVVESFVLDEGRWIAMAALAGKASDVCEVGIAAGAETARGF
jgi:hypothetical protein